MSARWWPWVRRVVAVIVVVFVAIAITRDLREMRGKEIVWELSWPLIIASLAVNWLMYLVLIAGWRAVLRGWGQSLGTFEAIRIWLVSNLGKYVPGKVWAIAGMAVMAQRTGVSAAAATASAIAMQLMAIATGAVLSLALIGPRLLSGLKIPGGSATILAVAGLGLCGVLALTSRRLMEALGTLLRRPEPLPPVGGGALVEGVIANIFAWAGYGVAFLLLVRGTLPDATLTWGAATGLFVASYLAGFLFVPAPGGLGVREYVMVLLGGPLIGAGPAAAIAIASRLSLTVNEVLAAVPFLLIRDRRGQD